MMAVMCRRTVVVLIPARRAITSSCRPSAINTSTVCCAGLYLESWELHIRVDHSRISTDTLSGAMADEVADLLLAIAPWPGSARFVCAAPDVATALWHDLMAASDELNDH